MDRRRFFGNSLAWAGALGGMEQVLRPAMAAQISSTNPGPSSCSPIGILNSSPYDVEDPGPQTVDPSFHHAPEAALEAYKDLKFGIRIHWGVYSLIGSQVSNSLVGANRELQNIYGVLWQLFNPTDFNADSWMDLFERAGAKYFTYIPMHHDGFCMWDTKQTTPSLRLRPEGFYRGCEYVETVTNHYSIMDTPYKKDILKMVVAAARKRNMGFGLYYSNVNWHHPGFAWSPANYYYDPNYSKASDPRRWQSFIDYERAQVQELLTNYGPSLVFDFDNGWPKEANADMASLCMMVRKLQPNIIIRQRGTGAYGDYGTPERWIPTGPSDTFANVSKEDRHGDQPEGLRKFWKVIYLLGLSFSYLPNDEYHSKEELLGTLIDCTAKGGNFEVCVGPMPNGTWAPEQVERLEYVGDWLKVNGEAIYKTRGRSVFKEGDNLWFTATKDGRFVYAIRAQKLERQLKAQSVRAIPGSPVRMLGVQEPLKWQQQGDTLVVDIPPEVIEHPPCKQAFAFKIQVREG